MNTRKLKIILAVTAAAVIAPASVRAQEVKTLYILKDNAVVYSSPVSEIDSIIFYDPEPAVTPPEFPNGTVRSSLPVGKLTFMTYNLGANPEYDTPEEQMTYPTPAGPDGVTDSTVYGGLFQWGRPADGHQLRTSATTTTLATSAPPGHGDFISNGVAPYDWITPSNTALWGMPKTVHDPCPEGWRIPTSEEWQSIFDEASGNTIYRNEDAAKSGTKGVIISPDGETYTLFLPHAGYRGVSGDLTMARNDGDYWSSTARNALGVAHLGTRVIWNIYSPAVRGRGHSCRCVKEY